jgi:hypothetical protein
MLLQGVLRLLDSLTGLGQRASLSAAAEDAGASGAEASMPYDVRSPARLRPL